MNITKSLNLRNCVVDVTDGKITLTFPCVLSIKDLEDIPMFHIEQYNVSKSTASGMVKVNLSKLVHRDQVLWMKAINNNDKDFFDRVIVKTLKKGGITSCGIPHISLLSLEITVLSIHFDLQVE